MARNMSWNWIKYFIALAVIIYLLISFNIDAQAATKPSIFTEGAADTQKIDKGFKIAINWFLYFAMGLGAVSFAAGLVMSTPLIGETQKGVKAMKGSALVIIAAGLGWAIIAALGKLF